LRRRRKIAGGAAGDGPDQPVGERDVAPEAGRGGVTAVPSLVEQLTSRELEVLAMLAAGRSNQAIASQLVVTLDTVKKHVSHRIVLPAGGGERSRGAGNA
jgi:DNA-binding NarL/FixJ family response regulator